MKTKIFVIPIIIALIVMILPAASVFAAPIYVGTPVTPVTTLVPLDEQGLETEWDLKNHTLKYENLFFTHVQVLPSDYKDKTALARVNELLDKYAAALKQANAISVKHAGFDTKGNMLIAEDANKSIKDLAVYLHIMRALRGTIAEEGLKIHVVK